MRRLMSLLVVLGLVLGGAATQVAAASMAAEPCAMSMGGGGEPPCDARQPMQGALCIPFVGCALTPTLTAPELSATAGFASSPAWKTARLTGLHGRRIKPDLTPPIVNG